MADPLPPELKIPEISRLINRANQLRTHKPAIAYWCEYRAVNQIVTKGLHNASAACAEYTSALLERLESTKAERADDDSIMDNTAGQAYVEQFAQETFSRAERTMIANKVTRQTADTFDAAATFFDLTHEWGTPDAATLQKIKFAKWNAARILKAIREGRDPNETNPQIEADPQDELADLNPNDPEVQLLTSNAPKPVSIEHVADSGEDIPSEPSPIAPADQPTPTETYAPSPLTMSPAPPPQSQHEPPSSDIQPVPQIPQIPHDIPSTSTPPSWNAPVSAPVPAPISAPSPLPTPFLPTAAATPNAAPPVAASTANYKDLNQAQKHAKWAISALNFEDVPTAIQELRNALATLGVST